MSSAPDSARIEIRAADEQPAIQPEDQRAPQLLAGHQVTWRHRVAQVGLGLGILGALGMVLALILPAAGAVREVPSEVLWASGGTMAAGALMGAGGALAETSEQQSRRQIADLRQQVDRLQTENRQLRQPPPAVAQPQAAGPAPASVAAPPQPLSLSNLEHLIAHHRALLTEQSRALAAAGARVRDGTYQHEDRPPDLQLVDSLREVATATQNPQLAASTARGMLITLESLALAEREQILQAWPQQEWGRYRGDRSDPDSDGRTLRNMHLGDSPYEIALGRLRQLAAIRQRVHGAIVTLGIYPR
jgi:hypothetical protein